MKLFVGVALVISLAVAGPVWAQFYKYLDKHGNVRFTDDINQVPENQRAKTRSYVESESAAPSANEPDTGAGKKAAAGKATVETSTAAASSDSSDDVALAPAEEIRDIIMPINKKYSLKENIEALKSYAVKTNTRITFEYVMLGTVNDRDEDIKALARLMSTIPSKLNIIPFNSHEHMNPSGLAGKLRSTPMDRIQKVADKLREKNITVMLRNTQGDDIAAACGQLATKFQSL